MSPLSSVSGGGQPAHTSQSQPSRSSPVRAEDLSAPPRPPGESPKSAEVIAEVAARSQSFPPREDSLRLSAAAARYSLTNLESAREIAREIRDTVKETPSEEVVDVASGERHVEIADTLLG